MKLRAPSLSRDVIRVEVLVASSTQVPTSQNRRSRVFTQPRPEADIDGPRVERRFTPGTGIAPLAPRSGRKQHKLRQVGLNTHHGGAVLRHPSSSPRRPKPNSRSKVKEVVESNVGCQFRRHVEFIATSQTAPEAGGTLTLRISYRVMMRAHQKG